MIYAQQAENVKKALMEVDPANVEVYEENFRTLKAELDKLAEDFETSLSDLENKVIVVQHGAFGYLAHAFGLEQIAIAGLSSDKEPSARQIAEMQNLLTKNQVDKVYVDPALDSKIAETVASATGAELLPLRTLEVVSEEEQEKGVDYFEIMYQNLEQLIKK